MRILIFTPFFYPNLGGVETVTDLLASGLAVDNEVIVVTPQPPAPTERLRPYTVLKQASWKTHIREVRHADVVLMFSASLRFIWIPLLLGKPLVVNHYTWLPWRQRPLVCALQRLACLFTINVAPSRIVAHVYGQRTLVMPNPFDDRMFRAQAGALRDGDLVFLGRLVEEKGVDLLLIALSMLREEGFRPMLALIGTGPAAQSLHQLGEELKLTDQLHWVGSKAGEALAHELMRHRVMVVPSRWREPFGIVALEGLACGCRLVVPDHGGLMEAAGITALTFSKSEPATLAAAIKKALESPRSEAEAVAISLHLESFSVKNVAHTYLNLFESLI